MLCTAPMVLMVYCCRTALHTMQCKPTDYNVQLHSKSHRWQISSIKMKELPLFLKIFLTHMCTYLRTLPAGEFALSILVLSTYSSCFTVMYYYPIVFGNYWHKYHWNADSDCCGHKLHISSRSLLLRNFHALGIKTQICCCNAQQYLLAWRFCLFNIYKLPSSSGNMGKSGYSGTR